MNHKQAPPSPATVHTSALPHACGGNFPVVKHGRHVRATVIDPLPDWAEIAVLTRDPAKRRVAAALALLEKPHSPDDERRFRAYEVERFSLARLEELAGRLNTKRFETFSPRRATLMATVVSRAAKRHLDAIKRGGGDQKRLELVRLLVDEPAVERALLGHRGKPLQDAIRSFLPVAMMDQHSFLDRTEHPVLTLFRRMDPAIDDAMRHVDAEAALIRLYESVSPAPGVTH